MNNKEQHFPVIKRKFTLACFCKENIADEKVIQFLSYAAIALTLFLPFGTKGAGGVYIPPDTGLPDTTFQAIFTDFLNWLLLIFGFLALISFVVIGIMYLVAAGDKEQQERAKKQLQWSIIGVIVALSAYVILQAINSWFGGSSAF